LLFGQFDGESFATALPEIEAHCGQVVFERADSTHTRGPAKRGYPQFLTRGQSLCLPACRGASVWLALRFLL
jgi:hypothetical protein